MASGVGASEAARVLFNRQSRGGLALERVTLVGQQDVRDVETAGVIFGGSVTVQRTAAEVAALSKGTSAGPILAAAVRVLHARAGAIERLVDVGCGAGDLLRVVGLQPCSYVGVDLVRYERFPSDATGFVAADLNSRIPLEDGSADAVVSVETIEHLENPRAFMRELVRLTRPGGLVLVTTPNQLSSLSKLTLLVKNRFNAFTDRDYPAHITALLETDLRRIAAECGLADIQVTFTDSGRIPGTPFNWPRTLGLRGRWFSDNVLMSGLKPRTTPAVT
jgi:2-polyprenyl-3-methyl-5-hydroxy-6-metoxy-1,4-benzoquinol methylase